MTSNAAAPTVYLVEDNPIDAKVIQKANTKLDLGWTIAHCDDGETALDHLVGTNTHVDLVLLDLNLPGLDGKEILKRLRADERRRAMPVVVVTTSTADNDITDSYRLGANAVVHKPDNLADWQRLLVSINGFWFNVLRPGAPPRLEVPTRLRT